VPQTPPAVADWSAAEYLECHAGSSRTGGRKDPAMKTNLTITAAKVLTAVAFLAAIGAPKKW
jgi:hypothetical protein